MAFGPSPIRFLRRPSEALTAPLRLNCQGAKSENLGMIALDENAIRRTPLWPVTTEDHYPTNPQFAVDAYHWTRQ
jgi:hypothetical protein